MSRKHPHKWRLIAFGTAVGKIFRCACEWEKHVRPWNIYYTRGARTSAKAQDCTRLDKVVREK